MRKNVSKVIIQKQKNLDNLNYQASQIVNNAFSVVRSLESVNAEIDSEVEEIEDLLRSMEDTKQNLSETKHKNAKIIDNFKKLFEV